MEQRPAATLRRALRVPAAVNGVCRRASFHREQVPGALGVEPKKRRWQRGARRVPGGRSGAARWPVRYGAERLVFVDEMGATRLAFGALRHGLAGAGEGLGQQAWRNWGKNVDPAGRASPADGFGPVSWRRRRNDEGGLRGLPGAGPSP